MKRLLLLLSVGLSFFLSSCKDDSKDPMPDLENLPVILPQFTEGLSYYEFNAFRNGPVSPVIEFTIDPGDQRDVQIATVEVYKTFRRLNGTTPDYTARVKVGDYTSFPAVVRLSGDEALAGITRNGAALGKNTFFRRTPPDAFVFTFEYVLQDGRRIILTPLSDGRITGPQANAPFAAVAEVR